MIEEKLGDDGTWFRNSQQIGVPESDGGYIFEFPMFGPGNHETVMNIIDSEGLLRPTLSQILLFVERADRNIRKRTLNDISVNLRSGYIWTATEKFSRAEGVYIYDNIDRKMPEDESELIKMYERGDSRIRFVERGFKDGDLPINESWGSEYILGLIGGKQYLRFYQGAVDTTYSGRFNNLVHVSFNESETNNYRFIAVGIDSGKLRIQDYSNGYDKARAPGVKDTRGLKLETSK